MVILLYFSVAVVPAVASLLVEKGIAIVSRSFMTLWMDILNHLQIAADTDIITLIKCGVRCDT